MCTDHVCDHVLRRLCVTSAVHTPMPTNAPSSQVYHPNIDLEGKICLNILREDWKPVLSISSVVYGLQVGRAGARTAGCLGQWSTHGSRCKDLGTVWSTGSTCSVCSPRRDLVYRYWLHYGLVHSNVSLFVQVCGHFFPCGLGTA